MAKCSLLILSVAILAGLAGLGVAAWWVVGYALLAADAAHCRANLVFIAMALDTYEQQHGAYPYIEGGTQAQLFHVLEDEANLDPWFRREAEEGWRRGYPLFEIAHRPPEDWQRLKRCGAGELSLGIVGRWPLVWCRVHPDWPEVHVRGPGGWPFSCASEQLERINACADAIGRAEGPVPDLESARFFEWGFQARIAETIRQGLVNLRSAKRNSLGMLMVPIPGGRFHMGLTPEQVRLLQSWATPYVPEERWTACVPRHEVEVDPFWASLELVPTDSWDAFLEATGRGRGPLRSSWGLATAFCWWLTEQEREARRIGPDEAYRLPTEAEWEWMVLAGGPGPYPWGEEFPREGDWGVFPYSLINRFGILVWSYEWELCLDWFDPHFYARSPFQNPLCRKPPDGAAGPERVMRGGQLGSYWSSSQRPPLCGQRSSIEETTGVMNVAFRLVLSPLHLCREVDRPEEGPAE